MKSERTNKTELSESLELLIEACKKNDRTAQEKLYRQFAKPFFQVALSFCGDREMAKEVLQNAFIKIFKKIKQYNQQGSFEGWMRRILRNTAIDYHRANSKMPYFSDISETFGEEELGEDAIQSQINTDDILDKVKQLPEGARMVFNLFAVEGFSHKEIAEQMNISVSTSKSQYIRARHLLMSWIKKEYHA